MGIVITVAMLLALIVLWPSPWQSKLTSSVYGKVAAFTVLLAGLWNALWHGIRHLQSFWGQAAIVSGCFMIAAAALIYYRFVLENNADKTSGTSQLQWFIVVGLLISFVLYLVTLIQLNLGYPIIR